MMNSVSQITQIHQITLMAFVGFNLFMTYIYKFHYVITHTIMIIDNCDART